MDPLRGLKENVIVGKMIPAGTGSTVERESTDKVNELANELKEIREQRNLESEALNQLPEEMIRMAE